MKLRPFATCLLLGFGATYFGCAPTAQQQQRRPAAGALAERACLEAATAETAAARKQAAFRLSQTASPERQAQLVELQRIRSRIATGRMPDEELVAWGQVETPPEQPAAQPAPADSQQNIQPSDGTQPIEPDAAMQETTITPDTSRSTPTPAPESETAPAPAAEPAQSEEPAQTPTTAPESEAAPAPTTEPAQSEEPAPEPTAAPESEATPAPAVETAPTQEPAPAPPATENGSSSGEAGTEQQTGQ